MAVLFRLTIRVGRGADQHEREIVIDPDELSMGTLEDLETMGSAAKWSDIRPVIVELLGLTTEEFRALTRKQFMQIAAALSGSVAEATTIPNAPASLSG